MTVDTAPELAKALLTSPTRSVLRPCYEGANICTWIGFKHVNYLVEQAVLEHFRAAGLGARALYETYALGLDIVDLDTRILHALHVDDAVEAEVSPAATGPAALSFRVVLRVPRAAGLLKAVTARASVTLRADSYLRDPAAEPPAGLARFAAAQLGRPPGPDAPPTPPAAAGPPSGRDRPADPVLSRLIAGANAFGWKSRIPYMYCHFSERLQMSGYLRQMEAAADLFLADRGISIKQLLDDRRWIPVVPHSHIQIRAEALMEEDLYTVYTVTGILKDLTYTARMDCYVLRGGEPGLTATGTITHGYAVIDSRRDWHLVNFDARVAAAISGGQLPG
jgi:acyl-CoA thioesterase FadM